MEMIDIVKKLIGPIEPIGDSSTDEKRLENLREFIKLAREMIDGLKSVEKNSKSHMGSVSFAGKTAKVFLDEIKEEL
jgi:hypothetical protein